MIFEEVQKKTPWWMYLIILPLVIVGWWGFVQQIIFGIPFGNNPASDLGIYFITFFSGILMPLFILNIRQITRFDGNKITIIMFPIWKTSFTIDQIEKCYPRKFNALTEFGGWGIKFDKANVVGYINFGASEGVQFELKKGRKVLIGSTKTEEFISAIKPYIK